jgi:hypothetical protein
MTTSTPTNPGSRIQLAIHQALRRDVRRLTVTLNGGHDISVEGVRA